MHLTQHEQFWLLPKGFSFTEELVIWDTSIQGTPPFRGHKIWSRKNVHVIFVFVTSILRRHLYSGERGNLSGSGTRTPFSTQKVTDHKNRWNHNNGNSFRQNKNCLSLNWCTANTYTTSRGKLIMIFIHYLAAWDNDSNQLSRRTHAKMFSTQARRKGKIFYLSPFRGHLLWFRGYPMNGGSTVIIFKISWEGKLLYKKKLVCYKII